jgi:hypothetical protein
MGQILGDREKNSRMRMPRGLERLWCDYDRTGPAIWGKARKELVVGSSNFGGF